MDIETDPSETDLDDLAHTHYMTMHEQALISTPAEPKPTTEPKKNSP